MSIFTYIKSHAALVAAVGILAVSAAVIGGRAASSKKADTASDSNMRRVTLADAETFRTDAQTVSADGTVESVSQADVKSQLSGPLSSVNVSLGDTVHTGDVIAVIANSDLSAQLDQVQGQYNSARESVAGKIRDAYLKGDDAIHTDIDQLILNTTSNPRPQLYTYVIDLSLANKIRDERTSLDAVFMHWKSAVDSLAATSSSQDIASALAVSDSALDSITGLLDDMSQALSATANVTPSANLATISAMQATISAARLSISGARQSLTTATVPTAEASIRNLEAQYAKSIITAPISGTIASLPLRVGELAAPGTLIATIVGPGGLQVRGHVSAEDLPKIARGAHVAIDDAGTGIVTSIAPSVDPSTKKAEVKISVNGSGASKVVIGQTVPVEISVGSAGNDPAGHGIYRLPIQDIKIVPGAAYVFTADISTSTATASTTVTRAVRKPVTLGAVTGDFIEVTDGIMPGMKIITPVYEIEDGQAVEVQ